MSFVQKNAELCTKFRFYLQAQICVAVNDLLPEESITHLAAVAFCSAIPIDHGNRNFVPFIASYLSG